MITIGQMASCAGVTVRAIRYYHQRGLLAEPARDASGYRRYTAADAVELLKIATLADAGVPLARIGELLASDPEELATAIAEIDGDLGRRIARLQHTRQRITSLVAGDRLVVPADVADYLDRLRALGVSERYVGIERDGWILIRMAAPDDVADWIATKLVALDDGQFQQICLDYDRCMDWDADDPRLDALAERMADFSSQHHPGAHEATSAPADPTILKMIEDSISSSSPAWERLGRLVQGRFAPPAG